MKKIERKMNRRVILIVMLLLLLLLACSEGSSTVHVGSSLWASCPDNSFSICENCTLVTIVDIDVARLVSVKDAKTGDQRRIAIGLKCLIEER